MHGLKFFVKKLASDSLPWSEDAGISISHWIKIVPLRFFLCHEADPRNKLPTWLHHGGIKPESRSVDQKGKTNTGKVELKTSLYLFSLSTLPLHYHKPFVLIYCIISPLLLSMTKIFCWNIGCARDLLTAFLFLVFISFFWFLYFFMCAYTFVCVHIYVCMCAYMFVCVHIYDTLFPHYFTNTAFLQSSHTSI